MASPDEARGWLSSLARDTLEHSPCRGCRANAATALDMLGELEATLERLGMPDPRQTFRERTAEPPSIKLEPLETHTDFSS